MGIDVIGDFKDLFKITSKWRHDSFTDHYSRIFMLKICLAVSLVTGMTWYTDDFNCIIPENHGIDGKFVASTCWIQGLYVYKELKERLDNVAYFGIPKDITQDGYLTNKKEELCAMVRKLGQPKEGCTPLTKTFYAQYQYFPFLMGAFAFMFYLPYIVFKFANGDMMHLRNHLEDDYEDKAKKLAHAFFDPNSKDSQKNIIRVISNVIIKIMYVGVNWLCFLGLNNVLDGEYFGYGGKWVSWSRLDNKIQYDYMGYRDHPKPGNVLLPPFGYCEVHASAKDIKDSYANRHKLVCEMSQHILYQYTLLILWFALILGIALSILGLIILLVHYIVGIWRMSSKDPEKKRLTKALSFRELEYLEFIRTHDIGLYGGVCEHLVFLKFEKEKEKKKKTDAPPNYYSSL